MFAIYAQSDLQKQAINTAVVVLTTVSVSVYQVK